MTLKQNPIFCALDTADLPQALKLASQLKGHVYGLKCGLEFYMAQGTSGFHALAEVGLPLFLDVKLHDIPNTVAGALSSLTPLSPHFITLHTSGGAAMMRMAADTNKDLAAKKNMKRPLLLGVTVLTSLDPQDLTAVGQASDPTQQVVRLAKLAQDNGLDGVICSAAEIAALRSACGKDFILMVPGIRPEGADTQDQKRVMTPRQAMDAGATYLVIGRPITEASNPALAAQNILDSL